MNDKVFVDISFAGRSLGGVGDLFVLDSKPIEDLADKFVCGVARR